MKPPALQLYIPPTDKDQLLLELQKPSRIAKALQALFDDRCLSYIKKDVMMEVLKGLVKNSKAINKAQNKAVQEADGKPFNLLQMIIRYAPVTLHETVVGTVTTLAVICLPLLYTHVFKSPCDLTSSIEMVSCTHPPPLFSILSPPPLPPPRLPNNAHTVTGQSTSLLVFATVSLTSQNVPLQHKAAAIRPLNLTDAPNTSA